MSDLISREAAIECAIDAADEWDGGYDLTREEVIKKYFAEMPAVDAIPVKHGKWKEKLTVTGEGGHIDEWQSARCSNCGRYHTTPYTYYFTVYEYCPNCGAKMDERENEK